MTAAALPLQVAQMLCARPAHELVFVADRLMDQAEMHRHCPSARLVSTASARNRALVFNGEETSVLRQPGSAIYGVLFEIPEAELPALGAHLADPGPRQRRSAYVRASDGRLAPAVFYEIRSQSLGPAEPRCVLRIAELGRRLGFPRAYLDDIRSALGMTIH